MAFDGASHFPDPLLSPYHSHPQTPSTATAYASCIRAGYSYSQKAQRLIGIQLMPYEFDSGDTVSHGFSQSTYVDIAEFDSRIPTHAESIVAVIRWFGGMGDTADQVEAHHRVQAIAGGTDTGTDTVDYREPFSTHWANFESQFRRAGTWSVMDYEPNRSICSVALSNADRGGDVVIRVQAYAVGQGSTSSVGYLPVSISAWWEAF